MAPRSGRVNPQVQTRGAARSFVESLDTYYQPARDTRKQQALQNGLGQIGSMFETRAAEVQEQRRKNFFQQGTIDALAEQAGQELKGVREGNIFRQHSQFYQMGLNEGRGSAAAIKWKNNLAIEFEQSGIDAQKDPDAFRSWMDSRVNEFLTQFEGNDYAIQGAMPHVREAVQNFSSTFTARLNENLAIERNDIFETEVFDTLDKTWRSEISEEDAAEVLLGLREELFLQEGDKANDDLVRAVIRHASTTEDARGILMLIRNRDSSKLNLAPRHLEALEAGLDAVEAAVAASSKAIDDQERRRREALTTQARNQMLALARDGNPLNARQFYEQFILENNGGQQAEWLYTEITSMNDTIIKARTQSEPATGEIMLQYKRELMAATTHAEKMKVIDRYARYLGEDVFREVEKIDPEGAYSTFIAKPQNREREASFVKSLKILESDELAALDGATGAVSVAAQAAYVEAIQELRLSNPNMTDYELHKEAAKMVGEALLPMIDSLPNSQTNLSNNPQLIQLLGLEDYFRNRAVIQTAETGLAAAAEAAFAAEAAALATKDAADAPVEAPASSGIKPVSQRIADLIPEFNPREPGAVERFLTGAEAPKEPEQPKVEQKAPEPAQVAPQDTSTGPVTPPTPEELSKAPDPTQIPEGEPYPEIADRYYAQALARLTDGKDDRKFTSKNYQQVFDEDPEFAEEVVALAFDLGTEPEALMAVMEFESGFRTDIRNAAGSGATGLIQFMPATARALGTTTDALAQMSRKEQMKYVRKYFEQFGDRLRNGDIDDVYMTVLYPAAVGKPDGYVLFRSGTIAYRQNAGLDTNKDGTITKFEAAAKVRKRFYGA